MKRQQHNPEQTEKMTRGSTWLRTVDTRLHLNRLLGKEATLSVTLYLGGRGPGSPQHGPVLSLRHGHWSTSGEAGCAVPAL